MYKLIALVGKTKFGKIAILDTPCFPAKYYAGYVKGYSDNELCPAVNDTDDFYRTIESAIDAADILYKKDLTK